VSTRPADHGANAPSQPDPNEATPRIPSDDELARMSTEDLVRLGNRLDDIEIVSERERCPEDEGGTLWSFYTPVIGLTFGFAVFALGMGVVAYTKKLLPEDLAIQQRHDGRSQEIDRATAAARLVQTGQRSGIGRRKMIFHSIGAASGVLGAGVLVAAFGGLVNNPWKQGKNSELLVTDWHSEDGERVYLRRDTGEAKEVVLVRPGDLEPGAIETVYPFKESMRGNEEELKEVLHSADSPVMLIRLRPNVTVIKRAGQEDFNYGTLFAYSKICSHMGCPTSLYEDQTNRILCPCHQSQFQANEYAKPVFGPAARPLAQLPIAVDDQGYLYARSDFIEPVGPAFWERNS
jgi:ubiquinol-cytochrome c reductase iron-sulfur subunit